MTASVTRREWIWVAVVAALLVAASTVPYVAAYCSQTSTLSFNGALLDRVDYSSHIAKMWQGYRGEWQDRLLFTSEPHDGVYLRPFYISLGHLARLTGLSLALIFQAARVACSLLLLLLVYRFIALFVSSVRTRRIAFGLAVMASGLGWLIQAVAPAGPGGVSPMDFWLLDGFTYLSVFTFPHFAASGALMLAIFVLLLRRPEGPAFVSVVGMVLASVALGIVHPHLLVPVDLLSVMYCGVVAARIRRLEWRVWAALGAMGLVQLLPLGYDLWIVRTQPAFSSLALQDTTLSPPLSIYLAGHGVLLALGLVGVAVSWRRRSHALTFLLLWIGMVVVLIYLPWNQQRRFLEGVQIPLGILAGVGLAEGLLPERGYPRPNRLRWLALAVVILFTTLSNLQLTVGFTAAALAHHPGLFSSADTVAAIGWLGRNTSWDQTVLSDFDAGNMIVGRLGHRVVLGHWVETIDYETKRQTVARFFDAGTADADRQAILRQYGVAYVFCDRANPDQAASTGFGCASAPYLHQVFANGAAEICRVEMPH